jgi:hypothetical protein
MLGRFKPLVVAVAIASTVAAAAEKKPPFLTREDLAKPWIGHSASGQRFRFALNLDGTGLIACIWSFQEPEFFSVTKWAVDDRIISIEAVSEAYPEETLTIAGKGWLGNLDLKVKAKWRNGSGKWKLEMFPEALMLKDYETLRDGMARRTAQPRP